MEEWFKTIIALAGWTAAFILGIDRYYIGKKIREQGALIQKLESQLNSERRQINSMRVTYQKALREITAVIQDENMKAEVNSKLDRIFQEAELRAEIEEEQNPERDETNEEF